MTSRLRVLAITRHFPNSLDPTFGIFNGQQFAALGEKCHLEVFGVVPWFPGIASIAPHSAAGRFITLPETEVLGEMRVRHPRVVYLPKVGHALSAPLYAASLWPKVRQMSGAVDVVLGSWAYPDGVAALMLARRLGAAGVVKVHGSDLNVIAERPVLRRIMRSVLPRAERLVAVSRPLAEKAIALGVPRERTVVVPNGIDRAIFHPRPRDATRRDLGHAPDGRWILFVGRLDRAKGVVDLMDAFERLAPTHTDATLVLVGGGPELGRCRDFADRHKGRVIVTGMRRLEEVGLWVSACDVLALPSWNEGTPNVVLEAFASGRRVVATRTGGIPDLVSSEALGEMVPVRDIEALAEALVRTLASPYDSAPILKAAPVSWPESAALLLEALKAAAAEKRA